MDCNAPIAGGANLVFSQLSNEPIRSGCTLADSIVVTAGSPFADVADFHLDTSDAAIINAVPANVSAALAIDHDIDGDARPAGSASDYGADESK